MNVLRTLQVELCLDGSATVEYHLDSVISRAFIDTLGSVGRSEYFPRFARPFFRITRSGAFIIKGVEGDTMLQVSYLRSDQTVEKEVLSSIRAFGHDRVIVNPAITACSSVH